MKISYTVLQFSKFAISPAECIDDQEVAQNASDANSKDDSTNSVMSMIRHVHCWERVNRFFHHGNLEDTGAHMN